MKRHLRILLPWFEPRDAVAALLGFRLPAEGEEIAVQSGQYEAQRNALLARPAYREVPINFQPLPDEIAPHGVAVLDSLPIPRREHSRFSTGIADLTSLISFQKAVTLDDLGDRVDAASQGDWKLLAELCLPISSGGEELNGTFDKDGRGITISSLNPNLRAGPVQSVAVPGAHGPKIIGFSIVFGTAHVHVVEYKGRYLLKDGYHRCYGLLSRGITKAPVVIERARSFSDVHSGGSTVITQEYLLGTHPPLLTDFLNPEVSATVCQQAFRKVIRIRAEECVVNI